MLNSDSLRIAATWLPSRICLLFIDTYHLQCELSMRKKILFVLKVSPVNNKKEFQILKVCIKLIGSLHRENKLFLSIGSVSYLPYLPNPSARAG